VKDTPQWEGGRVDNPALDGKRRQIRDLIQASEDHAKDPDRLFADGFESGDLGAWASSVESLPGQQLSVTPQAAMCGARGLEVRLFPAAPTAYLVDDTPAGETGYRCRFRFQAVGHVLDRLVRGHGSDSRPERRRARECCVSLILAWAETVPSEVRKRTPSARPERGRRTFVQYSSSSSARVKATPPAAPRSR
jgi:hypothetical protein